MSIKSDIQKYNLIRLKKNLRRSILLLLLCIVVVSLYVLSLIIMFHILIIGVELWYIWILIVFSGILSLLALGISIKEIINSSRHLHEFNHR